MEELKAKLEKLEERRFYINMIDHWSRDDQEEYNQLTTEINKIRELLKEQN